MTSAYNPLALGARAKGVGETDYSAYILDPGQGSRYAGYDMPWTIKWSPFDPRQGKY
jgi:hypothetical protein